MDASQTYDGLEDPETYEDGELLNGRPTHVTRDFAEHLRSGKTWAQARAAVVADQARHI
jgi:hypothetical protein